MAIGVTGKFKPKNNGAFALMDAADVEMPDGSRLDKLPEAIPAQVEAALQKAKESGLFQGEEGTDGKSAYEYAKAGGYTGTEAEFAEMMASVVYPVTDGTAELQPERFYAFGEVNALSVTLAEVNDGLAHEYCFEFTAAESFEGLTIEPAPKWVSEPYIESGKTYQVSVLRGIGVIVGA